MLLMTGCTSLNRFIGDNVSANSGRDMMLAMGGLAGGINAAGQLGIGAIGAAKNTAVGGVKTGKGLGQLAKGGIQTAKGMYHGVASASEKAHSGISNRMNKAMEKNLANITRGGMMQQSSNPIARAYGRMLESQGESKVKDLASKWNFDEDKYNNEYIKSGLNLAQAGINNIKEGFGGAFDSIRNIGNPSSLKYRTRNRIKNYGNESDSI